MTPPEPSPTNMPTVRTDLVDVYVFRRPSGQVELLQLRRADEPDHELHQTWQPVMGHLEGNEHAAHAACRELHEETGLHPDHPARLRLFALEQVHPYFLPSRNAIMFSPRFVCEVAPEWEPVLNHEHDAARWICLEDADAHFMWPGQRASLRELQEFLQREAMQDS